MYEKAKNLEGMSAAQIARIDMAAQSIRYALIEVGKSPLAGPDWYFNYNQLFYNQLLTDFTKIALKNGPKLLHETKLPPAEYEAKTKQFWKEAKVQHLAKAQLIKYHILPAASYQDGLNLTDTSTWTQTSSINDGLRSTQEYQHA